MQKSHIALLLLAIVGSIAFFSLNESQGEQSHNLMTRIESDAYLAFNEWVIKHAKQYREGEFLENFKFIHEHNQKYKQGEQSFELAVNKFADLDNFEFKSLYTGYKPYNNLKAKERTMAPGITKECKGEVKILDNPPSSVNWTEKNAVAPVRNQGACGSCWTFSTTGALEGLHAIQSGKIDIYSPQQIVDCASGYGENDGCNGGDMDAAMWYVEDNGITLDSKYAYHAKNQKCTYTSKMEDYRIKDCAEVPANKTIALQSAVAKQPVSIAVEADSLYFQFYSKGVFKNKKCGTDLDHGIVLTGYGNMNGDDFWQCKNSWGADWGMSGYILIGRDTEDGPGLCGILMQNTVPLN